MNDERDIELDEELDTNEEIEETPEQDSESTDEDADGIEDFAEDETEDDADETEEDYDYDEDGNIVLKDSDEEPQETAEESEEEATDEGGTDTNDAAEDNAELAALRKQYDDRENLLRRALKSVGIENENVDEAIAQLAAEVEGTTAAEWLKTITEENQKKAAEDVYKKFLFDKMVESDLAVLRAKYPETASYKKFEDIPNYKRFGQLRDLGLTAEEAYAAANHGNTRAAVAASVKKQSLAETKSHLHSNVPKAAKNNSVYISKAEMDECRELFPEMSDKDIIALYKKTK